MSCDQFNFRNIRMFDRYLRNKEKKWKKNTTIATSKQNDVDVIAMGLGYLLNGSARYTSQQVEHTSQSVG